MATIQRGQKWDVKSGGGLPVRILGLEDGEVTYETIERFGRRPTCYVVAEATFLQNFAPVAVAS